MDNSERAAVLRRLLTERGLGPVSDDVLEDITRRFLAEIVGHWSLTQIRTLENQNAVGDTVLDGLLAENLLLGLPVKMATERRAPNGDVTRRAWIDVLK